MVAVALCYDRLHNNFKAKLVRTYSLIMLQRDWIRTFILMSEAPGNPAAKVDPLGSTSGWGRAGG